MLNNNQIILTTLLSCGYADLELLEKVDSEILGQALDLYIEDSEQGFKDINTLIYHIFKCSILVVNEVVQQELEDNEVEGYEDNDNFYIVDKFESFHNFIDTHASLLITKEVYDIFEGIGLIEVIQNKFEELTDFNIEIVIE